METHLINRLKKAEGRIVELYNRLKGVTSGSSSNELTVNELAAIQGANAPSASNVFATTNDLGAIVNSGHRDIVIRFDTDGDYTFQAGDQNKIIIIACTGVSPQTLMYIVPEGIFSLGDQLMVRLVGTPNVLVKYLIQTFFEGISGNNHHYSADEALAILTLFEDTPLQNFWAINYISAFANPTINKDFANDAAAALNDVEIGEMYHTAGVVKIRLV